jgi:hypothetical protein
MGRKIWVYLCVFEALDMDGMIMSSMWVDLACGGHVRTTVCSVCSIIIGKIPQQ